MIIFLLASRLRLIQQKGETTVRLLNLYSDKLANQQAVSNRLYFCCTVVHWEEFVSAKIALDDVIVRVSLQQYVN